MGRIFNLMADWSGSGRYRAIMPSVALAGLGHEVMCSRDPGAKHKDGSTFAASANVFVAHRIDSPENTELWQRLARGGRTAMMVLDLDDNIWNIHESNSAYGLGFPKRFAQNARVADVVTVCSNSLAEIVRANTKTNKIHVLPNCIPEEILDFPRESPKEHVRLIFGGSTSHVIDIPILKRILPNLGDDFHFRLLGDAFDLGIDPQRIEYGPWTDDLREYYVRIDGDIGLAPLAEDPFNYGKSDLKIIEYMTRGIPFVASNLGPYSEIAHLHGKAGLFVKTDDEWVCAVKSLIEDESLRSCMGQFGKEWIRNNRTITIGALQREKLFGIGHLRGDGIYAEFR